MLVCFGHQSTAILGGFIQWYRWQRSEDFCHVINQGDGHDLKKKTTFIMLIVSWYTEKHTKTHEKNEKYKTKIHKTLDNLVISFCYLIVIIEPWRHNWSANDTPTNQDRVPSQCLQRFALGSGILWWPGDLTDIPSSVYLPLFNNFTLLSVQLSSSIVTLLRIYSFY